ncbi:MAG: glutamate--tRNA ligase [Bdellovibrionales bacterium]|nr:glutamate--tRNA ligase [Bdellovibrionales bacterium]
MNALPVRVRFAPSPTGFLHIGGVRTALFNYLYARQHQGKFLLRIEDTDTDRSEQRFTDDILSSLKWLGMGADEPILYQSKRLPIYQASAEDLITRGLAYRCTCTEAEVEAAREQMIKDGKKPMYARTCREKNLPAGNRPYAIRAKFPLTGVTSFRDLIRGEISFPNEDLDDFVMIRSNGVPTYNFVVVVDDIEMKISHVIRGDDHINNTPKQIFLYEALKAHKPIFAHLPMILGQDKKKLSKRNGETSTNAYREQGYLPEALLNFLVRLGWSHGDQELFTMEEMIGLFNLENVQVSGAVFNTEKLLWIAGEHLRRADPTRLIQIIKEDFSKSFSAASFSALDTTYALSLIPHLQPKVKLLPELAGQLDPLLDPGVRAVDASSLKWNRDESIKAKIKEAILSIKGEFQAKLSGSSSEILASCGVDHAVVDSVFRATCERFGLKLGELTQPLRLFITGHPSASIGLFDLLPLMPWKTVSERIEACLKA